jgi:hypothetical protein
MCCICQQYSHITQMAAHSVNASATYIEQVTKWHTVWDGRDKQGTEHLRSAVLRQTLITVEPF